MGIATALLEPRNDLMNDGGVKMPKRGICAAAKCPYYKANGGHEIYCTGLVDRSSIHVAFAIPEEKKRWMDKYCKTVRGCKDCPVRKMLENSGL